jgi:gas vesicle protein
MPILTGVQNPFLEKEQKMTTYQMQQESDGRHAGRFILGMLLGGLAGAVTLLLVAPQSGKETRKIIQNKTMELRDKTTATVESVSGQVRSKAGQIRTGVSNKTMELTQQGRGMLARQLDRLSVAAQNGKKALQTKGN